MSITSPNATIALLKPALERLGYRHEQFQLDDKAYSRFIAPSGGSWLTREAHISYPMLNSAVQQVSADKALAYELCKQHGIRTPKTISFSDVASHRNELAALLAQGPVVVKPSDASLSWGVTLNVRTREALEMAIEEARTFSSKIIAQQQVAGEEIRFVVVDGQPKAALLRQTARVIGDGQRTLQQLIDAENDDRRSITGSMVNYPQLDHNIVDTTKFDMAAVPANGQLVELNRSTMIRGGASIYNILDKIHDSYKQVAVTAAKALSAQFIVVDIMIEDYLQPASNNNYAFIEFNSAPVLALFYGCRDGAQYDAVAELVPRIDAVIRGRQV